MSNIKLAQSGRYEGGTQKVPGSIPTGGNLIFCCNIFVRHCVNIVQNCHLCINCEKLDCINIFLERISAGIGYSFFSIFPIWNIPEPRIPTKTGFISLLLNIKCLGIVLKIHWITAEALWTTAAKCFSLQPEPEGYGKVMFSVVYGVLFFTKGFPIPCCTELTLSHENLQMGVPILCCTGLTLSHDATKG